MKSHLQSSTDTYETWVQMRSRCRNPKSKKWPSYGGRGITVCKRWDDFMMFLSDMGQKPAGKTLDRINNNLGYFPENCKWSTPKEQQRNTRSNVLIEWHGIIQTISEWTECLGFKRKLISNRLRYGWTIDAALSTPLIPREKRWLQRRAP